MRVLFLTHRLPYAPDRGDRALGYHIVRVLAPRVELQVTSLVHDQHEAGQIDRVRALGADVSTFRVPRAKNYLNALPHLAGSRPLTHMLLDAPGIQSALERYVQKSRPDVVLAFCSSMGRFGLIRALDSVPMVVHLIDVDSVKWSILAEDARWPMNAIYRRESKYLGRFERTLADHARTTLVVNDREARILRAIAPEADVQVLEIGVDLDALAPPRAPADRPAVVFCGVMNYEPNVKGVLWFAQEVWPIVRSHLPEATFTIVGSSPTGAVRRLSRQMGISVTGTVPDVRPYLWDAALSVAPLTASRGVQNKVLEAVAAGLPAIVTPQVFEGIPDAITPACRTARTPQEFAEQVLALLSKSPGERRQIAQQADFRSMSWENRLSPLFDILERAAKM